MTNKTTENVLTMCAISTRIRWRYQPVVLPKKNKDHDDVFCIIEIAVDEQGCLYSWATEPSWSGGETVKELKSDLGLMARALLLWKPVNFDRLKVGMTFERTSDEIESKQSTEVARSAVKEGF